MKVASYLKGIGGLILVGILVLLAIIFFFVLNVAYDAVLAILAIVAIIVLPYYFGKKNEPDKKSNYSLKKIK